MSDLLVPTRRGFLTALGFVAAAPAIIRVAKLMPIKARLLLPTEPVLKRIYPHFIELDPTLRQLYGQYQFPVAVVHAGPTRVRAEFWSEDALACRPGDAVQMVVRGDGREAVVNMMISEISEMEFDPPDNGFTLCKVKGYAINGSGDAAYFPHREQIDGI